MRKLFLLIPALFIALMMNAAVISIEPGGSLDLRHAISNAAAGDTVVLADGEYTQGENYTIFNKNIVVMAAEDAAPVVKFTIPAQMYDGARVEFKGIKFDMENLHGQSWYEHLISVEDYDLVMVENKEKKVGKKVDGNILIFDGCEFYNDTLNNSVIFCSSERKIDSVIVNDCKFHDIKKSCIFLENTDSKGLIVTNSTFYNISTANKYYAGIIDARTESEKVRVDHCTFYNCNAMSTDYAAVKFVSSDALVSNCIFAMPEPRNSLRAIHMPDGREVKNCLVFNYQYDSGKGMRSGNTKTDCIFGVSPVFKDAANNDFTLRMGSPARGAGLANSNLGAPCWSKVADPVETDFASPLTLEAADAVHNEYFTLNDNNYLKANNPNPATEYGIATWQIHVTREVAVQVTLNNNSASLYGHTYKVEILDSNNVKKGEVAESGWKDTATPVTLSGAINLPAAGDYTVQLSNTCDGSGEAILEGITLAYSGGNVIDVPANTLDIDDAIFSANGTRGNGVISFPSATVTEGWAKWNINVTAEAFYEVALAIKNKYEHNMTVSFYEEDGTTLVGAVSEGGNKSSKDDTDGHTLNLGGIYLKVGNYVAKVTNARNGSDAKIMGVGFTYAGGAVQTMPGTTNLAEAWYSNNGTRTTVIDFPNNDIQNGYVKWNVYFANSSNYKVKVKVNTTSGHNYTVKLYRNETDPTPITFANGAKYSQTGTPIELEIDPQMVEAGNYILEVVNGMQDSNAELISVEFIYAGGGIVDLPATLLPMDAVLDQWVIENGMISGTEGNATTGSAVWNVASNGGKYNFKFNYSSDNGHLMKVEIIEEGKSTAKYTWNEPEANHWVEGDFEEDLGTFELENKNYVIKVTNTQSSSHAKITNIVANYQGGATVNLPGNMPLEDALLSDNAYCNEGKTELHFIAPEDVEFIADEYAKWNVHIDAEGVYEFTLNVVGTNYGIYTLTVDNGASVFKGKSGNGSVTLPGVLLTQGDHVIQIANTNNYADGYLTAVSAAPVEAVILDEMAENMNIITNNTGSHIPALKRTFRTGVYNSICVPFNVSSNSELERIFGEGYELLEMVSATLTGEVLTLNFATPENNIAYGRPYLIKPTKDVVNPVFEAHTISASTSHLIVPGDDANFVGVLNKQDLGTHLENLYLGADGNLYFSNSDVTIKGFRGYFHVNVSNPQQMIKHARIVNHSNVSTDIELVNIQEPKANSQKLMINGQLIILRDGVQYNVMGARMK